MAVGRAGMAIGARSGVRERGPEGGRRASAGGGNAKRLTELPSHTFAYLYGIPISDPQVLSSAEP